MTLKFKLFFYFLLPIIVSVTLVDAYNSRQELLEMERLANEAFMSNTKNATFAITQNSTTAITLLKASSKVLTGNLFGDRSESLSYLQSVLNGFADFSEITVVYETNADGNDERVYNSLSAYKKDKNKLGDDFVDAYNFFKSKNTIDIESWLNYSENGRFLACIKKNGDSSKIEPLDGIETREHYSSIKNRYSNLGDVSLFISEPFYKNVNLYIEYIMPLVLNNKFVGELSFSKDLNYLSGVLESFVDVKGSSFFLMSNDGKIVANTLDSGISTASIDDLFLSGDSKFNTSFLTYKNGRLIRDEDLAGQTAFPSFSSLYRDILRSIARGSFASNGIISHTDPKSGKDYILSYTEVPNLRWILVQVAPKENLYAFKENISYNSTVEMLVAFIAFIAVCLFFSYYTKRINKARVSVENMYEGRLHLQIPEIKQSKDESVRFINAVALFSAKIASIVSHSKSANSHLIDTAEKLTVVSSDFEQSSKHFDSYIGEISRSLSQISDTSKNIKDSVVELSKSLKRTSVLAKEEKLLLENCYKTIENLSENTSNLLNRARLIKDRAKTALACLSQISKIISQANLLSINTSIEARKSNEKGAVFLKISKEISILSKLISEYAKEISLVIRDLLESSFVSIEQTRKFSEQINSIKVGFEKLIPSVENTATSVDNALPEIYKINDSMSSQNLRKAQLNETINLLDSSSRQSNILFRQLLDLRRELNFSIEQITYEISRFTSKY